MTDLDRLLELQSLSTNTEGLPYSDGDDEEKELLIKKIQEAIEKAEKYDKKIEFWKSQGLSDKQAENFANDVDDAFLKESCERESQNKSLSEENARLKEEREQIRLDRDSTQELLGKFLTSKDFKLIDEIQNLKEQLEKRTKQYLEIAELIIEKTGIMTHETMIEYFKSQLEQLEQKDKILDEIRELTKSTLEMDIFNNNDIGQKHLAESLKSIIQKGEKK